MFPSLNSLDFDLHSYHKYLVQFSGGKDSTCSLLYLLEQGVPKDKIELWHQDIDGMGRPFFDWPITRDYCVKFAKAFGIPLYFQWKEGGFEREMLRDNQPTSATWFQLPDGSKATAGGSSGKCDTRRKFPQCSFDLRQRWSSGYLKVSPCSTAITNDPRFRGVRTLVISGERGEESKKRQGYAVYEPDRADLRHGREFQRHVDRFRPLIKVTEAEVWELIEKHRIRVHPCYYMGWPRCSCLFCIFGNADQFASAAHICPSGFRRVVEYERSFGCNIKRNMPLGELIAAGAPYANITKDLATLSMGKVYDRQIIIPEHEKWVLPAGAFKEYCKLL